MCPRYEDREPGAPAYGNEIELRYSSFSSQTSHVPAAEVAASGDGLRLRNVDEVKLVADAVRKPLNVLVGPMRGATAAEIGAAGAKRISVGGALAYAAMAPILRAGEDMLGEGAFDWLADVAPGGKIRELLD